MKKLPILKILLGYLLVSVLIFTVADTFIKGRRDIELPKLNLANINTRWNKAHAGEMKFTVSEEVLSSLPASNANISEVKIQDGGIRLTGRLSLGIFSPEYTLVIVPSAKEGKVLCAPTEFSLAGIRTSPALAGPVTAVVQTYLNQLTGGRKVEKINTRDGAIDIWFK